MSLSGSSEFLASSLFEVGSSSVNRASPFWSVHGIFILVFRIDVVTTGGSCYKGNIIFSLIRGLFFIIVFH